MADSSSPWIIDADGHVMDLEGIKMAALFTDYPHPDATFPGSTKSLMDAEGLTDEQRRAVFRDNAERFLARQDARVDSGVGHTAWDSSTRRRDLFRLAQECSHE